MFTALGFYPIQPGEPTYALGAPRFRRAELAFENGRTLVVEAVGVEELAAVYVQSVPSTGVVCRPFIEHERLQRGGTLRFEMGTVPRIDVYPSVP